MKKRKEVTELEEEVSGSECVPVIMCGYSWQILCIHTYMYIQRRCATVHVTVESVW